jgi:hypothetical protein
MRSVRRLVVAGATIALLAVLVPSVSAASPRNGALHVTKECSAYTHLAVIPGHVVDEYGHGRLPTE